MNLNKNNGAYWFSFESFDKENLVNGVTTRFGGYSMKEQSSFNFRRNIQNDPSSPKNFEKLYTSIQWYNSKAYVKQIHSSTSFEADKENTGLLGTGDAVITAENDILLEIQIADCTPIFIFDKKNRVISLIHSGWRGTQLRVLEKTLEKMRKNYNTNPKDVIAGIGPSIRKCCYEVKEELRVEFQKNYSAQEVNSLFLYESHRIKLDLIKANMIQLLNFGIDERNIEVSKYCTKCNHHFFFSYRHSQKTGRNLAFLGMKGF